MSRLLEKMASAEKMLGGARGIWSRAVTWGLPIPFTGGMRTGNPLLGFRDMALHGGSRYLHNASVERALSKGTATSKQLKQLGEALGTSAESVKERGLRGASGRPIAGRLGTIAYHPLTGSVTGGITGGVITDRASRGEDPDTRAANVLTGALVGAGLGAGLSAFRRGVSRRALAERINRARLLQDPAALSKSERRLVQRLGGKVHPDTSSWR